MYSEEVALSNYEDQRVAVEQAADLREPAAAGEEVFESIFHRYHPMVYQLTYRILGDREEALDVAQEVFVAIYRRIGRFRGDSSLKTWIYRITVNRASNRCRWWNRMRRRGTVSLDQHLRGDPTRTLNDTLASCGASPLEALLAREQRAAIERSLLRLPLPQRIAVIMRDVEGLSYEEIAESLQISLGTVKSRISRGREELKRRLNGVLG